MALAIAIALAGLSLPVLGDWRVRHRLRSEASAIGATLVRTLQTAAIRHDKFKVVVSERQLTVLNSAGQATNIQRLSAGFRFNPPIPEQILFSPGFVASPSRLVLSVQDHQCEITLSLRGRVQTRC